MSFSRSRSMIRARCTSTVLGDRPSSNAISLEARPWAMSLRISIWRIVSSSSIVGSDGCSSRCAMAGLK